MSLRFSDYKIHEENLKDRFPNIQVRVEPIDDGDIYYTDGDAELSACKIILNRSQIIYLPQLTSNVGMRDKKIIEEWIEYVKKQV